MSALIDYIDRQYHKLFPRLQDRIISVPIDHEESKDALLRLKTEFAARPAGYRPPPPPMSLGPTAIISTPKGTFVEGRFFIPHSRMHSPGRYAILAAAAVSVVAWAGGAAADAMVAHGILPETAQTFKTDFADPVRNHERTLAHMVWDSLKRPFIP